MADKIRAKVWVKNVTHAAYAPVTPNNDMGSKREQLEFAFVMGNDPENENTQFHEATPIGELTMTVDNPAAHGFFELGHEYYVDFTPAD